MQSSGFILEFHGFSSHVIDSGPDRRQLARRGLLIHRLHLTFLGLIARYLRAQPATARTRACSLPHGLARVGGVNVGWETSGKQIEARAMDMVQMQRFVRRKRWCEEQLRLAETDPNFQLLRRTHGGGQIDLTETHKKDLRDARDEYQRAIDYLER